MAQSNGKTKMCIKCHEVKPLDEFYKNRAWYEQRYCDVYCKDCARKMVTDKESIRRYFWDNNRLWSDEIWEAAKKKTAYTLANDEDFLRKNASKEKKRVAEDKAIAQAVFMIMNLVKYYAYSDNISEESETIEFDPESTLGTVITSDDGEQSYVNDAKVYSSVWNGKYTKAEIAYLDNYYQGIVDAFDIADIAMEDNVRKCAKASLLYDSVHTRYREGKATIAEVNAAQRMYDDNLKTANLAACKRKEKVTGAMALGNIVEMIENEGLLQTVKVEFPPDEIDKILEDFSHTAVAVGDIE